MTKSDIIKEKIEAETRNRFHNEIALAWGLKTLEPSKIEEHIKSTNLAISKNDEFLAFLNEELEKCSQ